MAKQEIPTDSSVLIELLMKRYPDTMDTSDDDAFTRGKKAGVVELLRELKANLRYLKTKEAL